MYAHLLRAGIGMRDIDDMDFLRCLDVLIFEAERRDEDEDEGTTGAPRGGEAVVLRRGTMADLLA